MPAIGGDRPGQSVGARLERLFRRQKLLRQPGELTDDPVIVRPFAPRLHCRQRGDQRGDIEHLAGGVVLGEVDEGMVGAPGQGRLGMAGDGNHRRPRRPDVVHCRDAFLRRARQRRHDHDRLRPQRHMPAQHDLGAEHVVAGKL